MSTSSPDSDSDRDGALARIAEDTSWHTWVGVGGILYASRPRTSPPLVVRAATADALRDAIAAGEAARRR